MKANEWLDVIMKAEDVNPAMRKLIVKYGEMLLSELPSSGVREEIAEKIMLDVWKYIWNPRPKDNDGEKQKTRIKEIILERLLNFKEERKCECENPDIGYELFDNVVSSITKNEFIKTGQHFSHTLLSQFKYCHDCGGHIIIKE